MFVGDLGRLLEFTSLADMAAPYVDSLKQMIELRIPAPDQDTAEIRVSVDDLEASLPVTSG